MMTKKKDSAEKAIRDIRRATRRQYSAEEKIRIVLEGLRGESSIAELCRKEGINQNLYYRWSKEILEAGKKRLAGDTAREANSDEVKGLRREAAQLKEALAAQLGALNQFLRNVSLQLDRQPGLVITGGATSPILPLLDFDYIHDPWLVFRGMLVN